MSDTDQAIRIAGLIRQLRELYQMHNNQGINARTQQAMLATTPSQQDITRARSALGEAVWDLSRAYRERSRQILSKAFSLA